MKQIMIPRDVEEMATLAVDSAFAVHKELGPGLLESAYEACFAHELELRGVKYQRQLPVPLNSSTGFSISIFLSVFVALLLIL